LVLDESYSPWWGDHLMLSQKGLKETEKAVRTVLGGPSGV
jgi:hypothetical protein